MDGSLQHERRNRGSRSTELNMIGKIRQPNDLQNYLDDEDSDDEKKATSIMTRRDLLCNASALAALMVLGGTNAEVARAIETTEDTVRSASTVKDKVVLQTEGFPAKYEGTGTSPVSVLQEQSRSPPTTTLVSNTNANMCPDPDLLRIQIFERTAPSVVFIDTFVEARDSLTMRETEVPLGTGSGFVWDDKGHIVTNYHVVRQAQSAEVAILTRVFDDNDESAAGSANIMYKSSSRSKSSIPIPFDGSDSAMPATKVNYRRKTYKAKVVGVDPNKDIAVLKVDAPVFDLFPIELSNVASNNIRVGQSVLAIGNPFGLDHTLTAGIISGVGREVRSPTGQPISNVLQTDAAINPGNSGGPLLDGKTGKLLGMNTAILSTSGGSSGIGFAIPTNTVEMIVTTLIRDGQVIRPILGISYLQSTQAKALGITKGVLVLEVPPDSAAARAGLRGTRRTESGLVQIGDVIRKVNDDEIETEADLFQALEKYVPGDRVKVTVARLINDELGGDMKSDDVVLTITLKPSTSAKQLKFNDYQAPQIQPSR